MMLRLGQAIFDSTMGRFASPPLAIPPFVKFLFVMLLLASPKLATSSETDSLAIESKSMDTSLVDAVESRHWQAALQWLEKPDQVKKAQPDGMTSLHWAVFHQQIDMISKLLEAGADPNAITQYQVSPMSIACTLGDSRAVELLIRAKANVSQILPGETSLLMLAARQGNPDVVRSLVNHGAPADHSDRKGQTALMWAAAEGNDQALQELLDAGADKDRMLKSGFTAMMFAAREGRMGSVRRLLDAGVDVNATMRIQKSQGRDARNGMSALMLAVESGHFELAMYLVQRGADPNDQRSGYAALHALTWVRKPKSGDNVDGDPAPRGSGNLTSLEFVRKLIEAGADVNLALVQSTSGKATLNMKGVTPFLLACKTADLPLLKVMHSLGADPHCMNEDRCTALLAAAGVGTVAVDEEPGTESEVLETLEYLMPMGLDINAVDRNQESVMHGAAYRAYPKVIAYLAQHGADPMIWNHRNKHGWTPRNIGEGKRPGSVKPSPPVIAALEAAMH